MERTWAKLVRELEHRIDGAGMPPFALVDPQGRETVMRGAPDGGDTTAAFRVVTKSPAGVDALASFDEYTVAMAYLDDAIDVEGDFLEVLSARRILVDHHPLFNAIRFLRPVLVGQDRHDADATPKHYDLGPAFYYGFLDRDHQLYSQALYRSENESLEQAARNKLEHIWESCRLADGSRVLDIGAGWGSFARYAADRGARVTMLTLSNRQYAVLDELSRRPDYAGRLEPRLANLFEVEDEQGYDAVVMLGVMEHIPQYRRFVRHMARLVRPGGRLYMDFAAVRRKYDIPSFTYRHVFEGNHTPVHMPGLVDAINASPFEIVAIHNDRRSYDLTLRAWARNLEAGAADAIAEVGLKTYRLFRVYLWATAHALGVLGTLESYRVLVQHARERPSSDVGL